MIFSRIQRLRFNSTLIILFITLQITACSTDNRLNADTGNIESGTIKINNAGTNNTTMFSGADSGSITKDIDSNNNNLLEVGGKLNITNSDTGETAFIANTVNGTYGNLIIDTAGNWNYAANNNQVAIQNLVAGATLIDNLTISSLDGTTHNITITIIGANKNSISASISLSWVAPMAREDNSALSLSAIAGYNIYYGTTQGQYTSSANVNDGSATGYSFNNFTSATYYFVVTTIDTDGRESQYSPEISISI